MGTRQREREIAAKGASNIPRPTNAGHIRKLNHDEVRRKILEAKKQQEFLIHGLSVRIHHASQLAEKVKGGDDEEESLAFCVSTMRKLKTIQQEYIQSIFVRRALEALIEHHEQGLVSLKGLGKDIKVIKTIGSSADSKKKAYIAATKWSDDELLMQLKKRKFFPIAKIKDSPVVVGWTDIPPFCNHNVAYQRSMEVAVRGFTNISIPTGYEKKQSPSCAESILLVSQAQQKSEEFRRELRNFDLKIHLLVKAATACLENNGDNTTEACMRMKEMDTIQAEYLATLKVMEGLKAFELHILHGIVDLSLASENLADLCALSKTNLEIEERGDEEHLARLEEKQFYPKLFPLVGGRGARVFYSPTAPEMRGVLPRVRPETKGVDAPAALVAIHIHTTRREAFC
ncbi:MAG: hypothetical protein SGBAC_013091 [Bacillariaceae sp.]